MTRGKEISQVESRNDMNAICLNNGETYVWPFCTKLVPNIEPYHFKLQKEKISSVSVGSDFIMYLTDSGRLYSLGKTNSYGELGLGDFEPRAKPTLIKSLAHSGDM